MQTDPNPNDTLAKLTELLRQANVNLNPQPSAPFGSPPMFAPQSFAPAVQPNGLLVALNIPTPQGDVAGYLALPAAALQNPQAALAQLQAAGWPLRIYGRRDFGGSYHGGNFQRGPRWGRRQW